MDNGDRRGYETIEVGTGNIMKMMTEHGNGLRGPWSWLSRVGRVKFGNNFGRMTEFGHEHPRHLLIGAFIASPMD